MCQRDLRVSPHSTNLPSTNSSVFTFNYKCPPFGLLLPPLSPLIRYDRINMSFFLHKLFKMLPSIPLTSPSPEKNVINSTLWQLCGKLYHLNHISLCGPLIFMRTSLEKKLADGSRLGKLSVSTNKTLTRTRTHKHMHPHIHTHTGVTNLKCNINTGHKNEQNIIDAEGKIEMPVRTADCR